MKTGLILNNIGTPKSFDPKDVKVYLDEFLMDPDVIGLPFLLRWLLVKGLITPKRSFSSAEKYKAVWMKEGSPLMVHSQAFAEGVRKTLGDSWIVRLGMRYGQPSLRNSLEDMRKAGVDRVVLAPLFPQFAEATTGSALKETRRLLSDMKWSVPLVLLPEFHKDSGYLETQGQLIEHFSKDADHLLFSFHGLPESQVCRNEGCLDEVRAEGPSPNCRPDCYRAQCLTTAFDLAKGLGLDRSDWSYSFQSRLGPAKWIGPATDDVLKSLGARKIGKLAVACPAFVADCLETLEEIGLGGEEDFLKAGGSSYQLIPCLNAEPGWVREFCRLVGQV
ncbi:MAG: ferrochelatase [Bdellovibrionaceae bacterium]|nr:ferrochelatase [Pseudobdellovibrionaceae bacterium]